MSYIYGNLKNEMRVFDSGEKLATSLGTKEVMKNKSMIQMFNKFKETVKKKPNMITIAKLSENDRFLYVPEKYYNKFREDNYWLERSPHGKLIANKSVLKFNSKIKKKNITVLSDINKTLANFDNLKHIGTKKQILARAIRKARTFTTENRHPVIVFKHNGQTKHYTLRKGSTIDRLVEKMLTPKVETEEIDSDTQFVQAITAGNKFRVKIVSDTTYTGKHDFIISRRVERLRKRNNTNGKYFAYFNTTDLDLKKYQIFTENDYDVDLVNNVHCLVHALSYYSSYIEGKARELIINDTHFPRSKLKALAKLLEITIKLYTIEIRTTKNSKKTTYYNKGTDKVVELALYKNHYFVYDKKTIYSRFFINNFDRLDKLNNPNKYNIVKISKNKYLGYDSGRKIDSLGLVHKLYELGKFKSNMGSMKDEKYYDIKFNVNDDDIPNLSGNSKEIKLRKKSNFKGVISFADIETYTRKSDGKMIEFMISYTNPEDINEIKTQMGHDCITKFLDDITGIERKTIYVYFHNMRFDITRVIKYVSKVIYSTKKGQQIYELTATYNRKVLKFRDTYKMISMPLSKFGQCFDLDTHKEVMPYEYYTLDNLTNIDGNIDEAKKYLKNDEEREKFEELLDLTDSITSDTTFNMLKYAQFYCEKDVEVLSLGFIKFTKMVKEHFGMDVRQYLSISSLAHNYLLKNGVYEGVCELSGNVRAFIQKSVIGGRVATMNNESHILIDFCMTDFDAVSLYPSAMYRLPGFPRGEPKEIDKINYNVYGTYFVEIKITKIGKLLSQPLLSYKNKLGTRVYNDDIENYRNLKMVVDRITLEDYIKYHEIEYEFVRGVEFNQGFNPRICEVISDMFKKRLLYKKRKNPVQNVFKMMMNSSYGKTILKPENSSISYTNTHDDFTAKIHRDYNLIKEITTIKEDENYAINEFKLRESITNHRNIPQVGSSILSMSKRIMNEVMHLDESIPIYYQDTDSMHIKLDDLSKLEESYNKKYERELVGGKLGQFHNDFNDYSREYKATYADYTVIVGKKFYVDRVVCKNKDGDIKKYLHVRSKGLPAVCVTAKADELGISVLKLYENLIGGEAYEFDLGKFKLCLEYKGYSAYKREEFKRTVCFNEEKRKELIKERNKEKKI